jgi:hypothetical protein
MQQKTLRNFGLGAVTAAMVVACGGEPATVAKPAAADGQMSVSFQPMATMASQINQVWLEIYTDSPGPTPEVWVEMTGSAGNPYEANFTVPAGTYDIKACAVNIAQSTQVECAGFTAGETVGVGVALNQVVASGSAISVVVYMLPTDDFQSWGEAQGGPIVLNVSAAPTTIKAQPTPYNHALVDAFSAVKAQVLVGTDILGSVTPVWSSACGGPTDYEFATPANAQNGPVREYTATFVKGSAGSCDIGFKADGPHFDHEPGAAGPTVTVIQDSVDAYVVEHPLVSSIAIMDGATTVCTITVPAARDASASSTCNATLSDTIAYTVAVTTIDATPTGVASGDTEVLSYTWGGVGCLQANASAGSSATAVLVDSVDPAPANEATLDAAATDAACSLQVQVDLDITDAGSELTDSIAAAGITALRDIVQFGVTFQGTFTP